MSKAPSMPMYWDAYLADTTHLTTEEHGAYLLLLAAMWRRNGAVPDDDKDNARIVGLSRAKWRAMKARLLSTIDGFEVRDGEISQKNLRKIWENTQEKIEKNRKNGSKGGRPKAKENNDLAKANGSISDNPNETIPEPEPYKKEDTNVSSKKTDDFEAFWAEVPRKVGKGAARKAFKSALKRASISELIDGMQRYADQRHGQDQQFTCHPATWLNQDRWLDEAPQSQADFHDEIERRLRESQNAIPGPSEDHHGQAEQLSAPLPAPKSHGQRDSVDGSSGDSRGSQWAHLELIRPRRFGGQGG